PCGPGRWPWRAPPVALVWRCVRAPPAEPPPPAPPPPPRAASRWAPAAEPRPPADAESLRVGRWLGIRPLTVTAAFATQYLADVREAHGLYAAEGLCQPGLLPRLMNWALTHNGGLGPWIHVGGTGEHFARVAIRAPG